jgi:GT2 family glycosyltransferase
VFVVLLTFEAAYARFKCMSDTTALLQKSSTGPAISAIVVVPDKFDELKRTMQHLKNQTAAAQMEIVFVVKTRQQLPSDMSDLVCFHSWCLIEMGNIKSIGNGFTAGIREAHAPMVALTEDHSFPDENWADAFISRHKGDYAVVGPSMRNGNPVNALSWADFYQAYGEWVQPVAPGSPSHLPGHNSSYKRDILLSLGNRLEDFMHAESVMHRHLVTLGYKLLVAPETCTSHYNFATWRDWIPSRYYTGRLYAAVWSRDWPAFRRYFFACASPLIPFIRLWRIERIIRRHERLPEAIRLIPTLFAGLAIEGFGHMLGYTFGAGNAAEKAARYEFHRIRI